MKHDAPVITYQDAIDKYFGGLHKLNKGALPFTCQCGERAYTKRVNKEMVLVPLMTVNDCFIHIRRAHKERIKQTKLNA